MSCCRVPVFGCVVLHGWLSCSRLRVCGASWLAVVLPPSDGWELRGLRPHIAAGHPGRGAHPLLSAAGTRRRNPSFKGIKMKGYCSIYQLFKISSWVALYKSFMDRNLTKTLFSIDYRGYFIIQATHLTLNYSYFLHETDRNAWKTNKIVQNHHKTNKKLLIIWFIRYKYISLHH